MKKIQLLFAAILAVSMLLFASCARGNENNQAAGTDAGVEANGDIDGSDAPYSNAESGEVAGDKVNEENTSAKDTIVNDHNAPARKDGAPMSRE
ncbi:MAG: hypothetical protein ACO1N9_12130 [Flavobacterium sp.]